MRITVPLAQASRLLNHGPVTLVTSAFRGAVNVMAASWATPLDFDPPKFTLVIDAQSRTRQLVDASGEFALSIPCAAQAAQVLQAGSASGHDLDKFQHSGLTAFPAQRIDAPLVEDCVAWLECRVIASPATERQHDLFLAEVVHAQADDRVFRDGRWQFDDDRLRTLHYYGGGVFAVTGAELRPASR